jgi:4-amino-4-deoxy-L-arabinose transferase-like glycosyltransferase
MDRACRSMGIRTAVTAGKKYASPVALVLFYEIATLSFLQAALRASSTMHFWFDEVLAVWTARLPTSEDVTAAVWKGAEFAPPTYGLLLHFLFGAFGSDPIVARLPSVLAVLFSAIFLAILVWRHLGAVSAALTYGLALSSPLFDFAVQARSYALLTALLSAAVLVWSTCKEKSGNRWQAVTIALLLFASVSLHVYAIVAFAVFTLMEVLWSIGHRRLRLALWLAFAAAAAASVVWLPLILHLATFNSADTTAPDFYGAPTLSHLADHVVTLFLGAKPFRLFVLFALFLAGGAVNLAFAVENTSSFSQKNDEKKNEPLIAIIGFGLFAALPISFLLAIFVTHVFSARYALAATMGAVLLFVLALRRVPYRRVVALIFLVVLCILPLLRAPGKDMPARALDLIKEARFNGPVVVGDGSLFIELMESAEPGLRSRLVYLSRPPEVTATDPSAEYQVMRLFTSFWPDLPVKEPLTFVAEHSPFLALCRPDRAPDALCPWFIAKGWVVGVSGLQPSLALLSVDASATRAAR